jgi:hypothetical protein
VVSMPDSSADRLRERRNFRARRAPWPLVMKGSGKIDLYAYDAYNVTARYSCQGKSFRDTLRCMASTKARKEISYPLSFRVPLSQVEEIDEAVVRERRKRRSDLLEGIWEVAWANYQRSGSLQSYAEGRRISKRTKRVSEELQDQLYTALETILERAPSALIEEVARKLTRWAGKFGEEK